MEIIDYFNCGDAEYWAEQIAGGEWGAAKFLAKLLREDRFHAVLGEGTVYLLADGRNLVSFVTLTHQDCVDDKTLFPWLGFFYTAPAYRGHRYGGLLLDHASGEARNRGSRRVYLATDHVGLYEKYGFSYWENRTDVYGEDSRIYIKELEAQPKG